MVLIMWKDINFNGDCDEDDVRALFKFRFDWKMVDSHVVLEFMPIKSRTNETTEQNEIVLLGNIWFYQPIILTHSQMYMRFLSESSRVAYGLEALRLLCRGPGRKQLWQSIFLKHFTGTIC